MKIRYIINNYQLGAKLRTAPLHELLSQTRLDRNHTEVIFEFSNDRHAEIQIQLCDKLFAKKGKRIE